MLHRKTASAEVAAMAAAADTDPGDEEDSARGLLAGDGGGGGDDPDRSSGDDSAGANFNTSSQVPLKKTPTTVIAAIASTGAFDCPESEPKAVRFLRYIELRAAGLGIYVLNGVKRKIAGLLSVEIICGNCQGKDELVEVSTVRACKPSYIVM